MRDPDPAHERFEFLDDPAEVLDVAVDFEHRVLDAPAVALEHVRDVLATVIVTNVVCDHVQHRLRKPHWHILESGRLDAGRELLCLTDQRRPV
jgi:hypothetical protein